MKRRKYEKNSIYQDRVDYTLWNTICKEILTEKISLVQELKMSNEDDDYIIQRHGIFSEVIKGK